MNRRIRSRDMDKKMQELKDKFKKV